MSLETLSAVWELDLERNEKDVLEVLAWHANADGICWPSKARIMYTKNLSESTVKRTLASLKKKGLITVEAHAEGGRGKTPIYALHPTKGVRKLPFEEWKKGVRRDTKGGQEEQKGVTAMTPEPSLEPSLEPSDAKAGGSPPPPDHPQGWHFEEYLRDELANADPKLTRSKARRYTGQANKLLKAGVPPEEIYEACDRVVSEWERVRLDLDDARRDLLNGRQSNGNRPPGTDRPALRAVPTPEKLTDEELDRALGLA